MLHLYAHVSTGISHYKLLRYLMKKITVHIIQIVSHFKMWLTLTRSCLLRCTFCTPPQLKISCIYESTRIIRLALVRELSVFHTASLMKTVFFSLPSFNEHYRSLSAQILWKTLYQVMMNLFATKPEYLYRGLIRIRPQLYWFQNFTFSSKIQFPAFMTSLITL